MRWILPGGLIISLLFFSFTAIIGEENDLLPAAVLKQTGPIPVIDPGHGGLDGGAVSGEGVPESGINLAIALKLEALLWLCGAAPIMTRSSETLDYPDTLTTIREKKVWDQKCRAALVNSVEGAVFLSIHQNFFPDARPRGSQALYGTAEGSAALAERIQTALAENLCPENRRVAAPISDAIYLMKQISCPAVLVECGFLSNPEEAKLLMQAEYQRCIALVLCGSYLQFIGNLPEETNERENEVLLYGMRE